MCPQKIATFFQLCIGISRAAERGGNPKRSIYSNRTVKRSIKAVTTYILPWAPQALSAALGISSALALLK